MKQIFTLLALVVAGAAQSQPFDPAPSLPASLPAVSRPVPPTIHSGPQAIQTDLRASVAAANATATDRKDHYQRLCTPDTNGRRDRAHFDTRLSVAPEPENRTAIIRNATEVVDTASPYMAPPQDSPSGPPVADRAYYEGMRTTGIADARTSSLQLYPNPATTVIYIEGNMTLRYVEVYAANGALVTAMPVNGRLSATVSVRDLPSGIYFLKALLMDGVAQILRFAKR